MDGSHKSILVVDDEVTMVHLCKLVFREAGYEVRGATSGRQALRLVSQEMPDIILLDVMMPGMDGIEVCRRIREKSDRIPKIVMYTADDRDATRTDSLQAGANHFLTKRVPIFELPDKIHGFLAAGTGPLAFTNQIVNA